MAGQFGAPEEKISSIWEIHPQVLEDFRMWLENTGGLRIPVGQVLGYQRERYVAFVGKSVTQSISDSTETDLTFDTTTSDSQKSFDGTSTITLPYNGLYLVAGYAEWASNTTG